MLLKAAANENTMRDVALDINVGLDDQRPVRWRYAEEAWRAARAMS